LERPKNSISIEVGRTLNLGAAESDIFGRQKYSDLMTKNKSSGEEIQSDKYEFLRKKLKPNEGAYDECFPEV